MSEFGDKLKTLSFGRRMGKSEQKRVVDERDGSTAGVVTEHWDGSSDAAARPKPIRVSAKLVNE